MSPDQIDDNLNRPVAYRIPAISSYYTKNLYIMTGVLKRKSAAGELKYRAELKDNASNSVIYVDLADVEPASQEGYNG